MNIPFVDLKAQYHQIKDEIDRAINEVIENTAFIKGKYVNEFENQYSKVYGVNHTISCANGTDAIYIALKSLGIGSGDEVITTACSWISTSETITQAGAKVVFCDIEPNFYTIDTSKIEDKITEKTKAIIPVHLYGHPVNMTELMDIAKKHNLFVIEDCAQAHFAKWDGENVGTFGDFATFSFFPGKNLGAYGDAGAIITNDSELADKARMYANHGSLVKHEHQIEGINSRLDGIQAAILSVKLKYIKSWTSLRLKHALDYNILLEGCDDLQIPKIHSKADPVFHLYVCRVKDRKNLTTSLTNNGISTAKHYPIPLPYLEAYSYLGHKSEDFPVSYSYQDSILSLPIYPEITDEMKKFVSEKIIEFYK